MDEMRAMLDQLMGEDRNLDAVEKAKYKPKKRHYTDRDVCKYYLAGFCPYEEFRRTKNDCGDCPGIHDDECRDDWLTLDDRAKERSGVEAELLRWIEKLLSDLRKRIDSNTARLQAVETPLFLHEDQAKLDAMTAQMKELLARAEALGEEGDVDGSLAATNEADRIKAQRTALETAAEARAGNNALKNLHQEVCSVSGLIINNDETRLRDHHQGRNFKDDPRDDRRRREDDRRRDGSRWRDEGRRPRDDRRRSEEDWYRRSNGDRYRRQDLDQDPRQEDSGPRHARGESRRDAREGAPATGGAPRTGVEEGEYQPGAAGELLA